MSGFSDYGQYDGLGLAELVRRKEVKPSDLVEEAVGRIEKLNPQLNAVIHRMYDLAREVAEEDLPDGPFVGVPFLLKDLGAACEGVPMCSGKRFHEGFVPGHDCEMVRRFKAAGVITLGKTNTPEYGLVPVAEPELFGSSNNPCDLTRTTGGSSGGSAAAVSTRMVPVAHGNDGGGSIRIFCSLLRGIRPEADPREQPPCPRHWRSLARSELRPCPDAVGARQRCHAGCYRRTGCGSSVLRDTTISSLPRRGGSRSREAADRLHLKAIPAWRRSRGLCEGFGGGGPVVRRPRS